MFRLVKNDVDTAVSVDTENEITNPVELELQANIKRWEKRINNYKLNKAEYDPILCELHRLLPVVIFSFSVNEVNVSTSGDRNDLKTLIRVLRKHGWDANSRPGPKATSFSAFWEKGDLRLYVNFQSTQCKRVQVGTRMVEEPVYETQCT